MVRSLLAGIPGSRPLAHALDGSLAARRDTRLAAARSRPVACRAVEPEAVFVEHDGLRLSALDWGGDGPPLLLLHPTGFCAGLFDPLAQALRGAYRPIGVDFRGCGASSPPRSAEECGWTVAAGDVIAVLDALALPEVLVLGESMGGAVAVFLDELRPGMLRGALLCEAIASAVMAATGGEGGGNRMAEAARRRRAVWPDRATAEASYGSRPPLSSLEPAALAAYVRWGFHDRPDGQVELACAPEVEAWYFEGSGLPDGAVRALAHLPAVSAPVTVVGARSSNLPPEMFAAQAEAADAPLVMVDGSHFFLQEDTARAAELVRDHLVW
jgi:pimeloyl-ACP methyl ester carboxylesterase